MDEQRKNNGRVEKITDEQRKRKRKRKRGNVKSQRQESRIETGDWILGPKQETGDRREKLQTVNWDVTEKETETDIIKK